MIFYSTLTAGLETFQDLWSFSPLNKDLIFQPWLIHALPVQNFRCEHFILSFSGASASTLWPCFPQTQKSPDLSRGPPSPLPGGATTGLTSLVIIIMSSRSITGHSRCSNCRFDHSLHFVSPHQIQAPLIGNSGLPKQGNLVTRGNYHIVWFLN